MTNKKSVFVSSILLFAILGTGAILAFGHNMGMHNKGGMFHDILTPEQRE